MTSGVPVDLSEPPPYWVEWLCRKLKMKVPPGEVQERWDQLTRKQQHARWCHQRRERPKCYNRLGKEKKAAAAAAPPPPPPPPAAPLPPLPPSAHPEVQIARSARRLAIRLAYSRGCIFPGCPLGPSIVNTPILALLEQDHIDPTTKVGSLNEVRVHLVETEAANTQCLCLWHHSLRTRSQRTYHPISKLIELKNPPAKIAVALWKEMTHCEYPHHDQMPYASLVPTAEQDPLVFGFMHVSHVKRGRVFERLYHSARHLDDLTHGRAVVHCSFCHGLYTACENGTLYQTPYAQYQLEQIRIRFPAFIEYFKAQTAGFDWIAERDRIRRRQADGLEKSKKEKEQASL